MRRSGRSWGSYSRDSRLISRVEYGSITVTAPATSGTATITSVDTTRSIVVALGNSTDAPDTSVAGEGAGYVTLTNGTTVTATKGGGGSYSIVINFMVIEFGVGTVVSIQNVLMAGTDSVASTTHTITSVSTTRTAVFNRTGHSMVQTPNNPVNPSSYLHRYTLTNATTLTKVRFTGAANRSDLALVVVEFAASVVASIQYGSITVNAPGTTGTATITSIDTARSVVAALGHSTDSPESSLGGEGSASVTLTNATTVTATKGGGGTYGITISFMVIEFAVGQVKSIQNVEILGNDSVATNTLTITSVSTTKTLVINRTGGSWTPSPGSGNSIPAIFHRFILTNSTTLTKVRNSAPATRQYLQVAVLEFN